MDVPTPLCPKKMYMWTDYDTVYKIADYQIKKKTAMKLFQSKGGDVRNQQYLLSIVI